jgi:hypothetical protein
MARLTPDLPAGFRPASSAGERDDPALGVKGGLAARGSQLRPRDLVTGVVRGAHQWRRLDMFEAERQRRDLHLG